MSCEKWRLMVQKPALFFSLSPRARRCGPPRPPRAAAAGRRGAQRRLQHFLWQLGKTSRAGSSLALRRRLLLAEQDAESSADSRSWLDHAHLRIFHSRKRGNQYALAHLLLHSSGYVHNC